MTESPNPLNDPKYSINDVSTLLPLIAGYVERSDRREGNVPGLELEGYIANALQKMPDYDPIFLKIEKVLPN